MFTFINMIFVTILDRLENPTDFPAVLDYWIVNILFLLIILLNCGLSLYKSFG